MTPIISTEDIDTRKKGALAIIRVSVLYSIHTTHSVGRFLISIGILFHTVLLEHEKLFFIQFVRH